MEKEECIRRRNLNHAEGAFEEDIDYILATYRDGHEASLLAARLAWLASWRARQSLDSLASPRGKASRRCPRSCTSEARCWALVSEASNEGPSSRLASPRLVWLALWLGYVTYKHYASAEPALICTLRNVETLHICRTCAYLYVT